MNKLIERINDNSDKYIPFQADLKLKFMDLSDKAKFAKLIKSLDHALKSPEIFEAEIFRFFSYHFKALKDKFGIPHEIQCDPLCFESSLITDDVLHK